MQHAPLCTVVVTSNMLHNMPIKLVAGKLHGGFCSQLVMLTNRVLAIVWHEINYVMRLVLTTSVAPMHNAVGDRLSYLQAA